MSEKNEQELDKDQTLENTAKGANEQDVAADDTDSAATIEPAPADSIQFSVTFDDEDEDIDLEAAGDADSSASGDIYDIMASAESDADSDSTADTDDVDDAENTDLSEAEADALASADTSAEVTKRNADRVNETLNLATSEDKNELAERADSAPKSAEPTMTLASRIDRVLVGGGADDILLKTYPTFALNKVTVPGAKGKVNVLDSVEFACYAGHAYALLVTDDPDSELNADTKRRALMGVMSGLVQPESGTVMNKSANIADLEPVDLRGHRLGIVPQLHAVQPDLDAEQNVLYAMNASNRNFLKPKPVIARELLAKVGFSEVTSGVAVGKLPLVQQRLVAIARAISTEAEVLILDEPTRGLNVDDTVTVFAALAKLAHSGDPKHCVIALTASREIAEAADQMFEI